MQYYILPTVVLGTAATMSRAPKETFRQRMQGFFGMRGPRGSNPGDGQFKKGEFFITPTLKKVKNGSLF